MFGHRPERRGPPRLGRRQGFPRRSFRTALSSKGSLPGRPDRDLVEHHFTLYRLCVKELRLFAKSTKGRCKGMAQITIELDGALMAMLKVVAEDQETSQDEIVRRALCPYLRVWVPPWWTDQQKRES